MPRVLREPVRAVRPQVLLIVQARHASQRGVAQKHFGQRVSRHAQEAQETARQLVAESILPDPSHVEARLDQMPAAHPGGGVDRLVDAGGAVLRVVRFVAELRNGGDTAYHGQ